MSQSPQDNLCECCGEYNAWSLLDQTYTFCCGECAQEGLVSLCEYTGQYRINATCRCGREGPVNYNSDQYYCGSGPNCVP